MRISTVIATIIPATILGATAVVAVPTAAQASWVCDDLLQCGDFKHKSPDLGFDDPIRVTCDWNQLSGNSQLVAEGNSATCHDVDGFYVGAGREVTCTSAPWDGAWVKYDTTGWKKITDRQNLICVHGLD